MSTAQTGMICRAYHKFGIPDEGPGVLPALDQDQIDELAGISEDQLRASFKGGRKSWGQSGYRGVTLHKKRTKKAWGVAYKGRSLGYYESAGKGSPGV